MKKTLLIPLLGLGAVGAVQAQDIVGRVISSTPVVQQVAVPRQVCTNQPVAIEQPKSGAGAAMGAIAGGVIGNQVGHGSGRALATMAGLIGGAVLGNNIEGGGGTTVQNQQQCTTQTFYENRTSSWNVTYEYAGRQYTVNMPYDPGPTIRLQVTPVGSNDTMDAPQQLAAAPATVTSTTTVVPTAPVTYVAPAPAYYAAPAPVYYAAPVVRPYYYPPVSLSLGYTWHSGGHHRHRH
jgi:uncharacterized protein YcfJ